VQVDTPSASLHILAPGLYRIDSDSRRTRAAAVSDRAEAELAGERRSIVLGGGQASEVAEGGDPAHSYPFRPGDAFDQWNGERTDDRAPIETPGRSGDHTAQRDDVDYERIPDEVRPYYDELSANGRWVNSPDYGTVWHPTGVAADWRPYADGRWVMGPYGWYWCSYDPWGWAPYHYGRWSFASSIGWVWSPGQVFSGAWVSWYYGPSYVGWCPTNYYGQPAFINIGFNIGGYGCDPHVWNFCPYNQVTYKYVNKVVIKNPGVVPLQNGVIVRRGMPYNPATVGRDGVMRTRILDDARHRAVLERTATGPGAGRVDSRGGVATRSFRDEERVALGRINKGETTRLRTETLDRMRRERGNSADHLAINRGVNPGSDRTSRTPGVITGQGSGKPPAEARRRNEARSFPRGGGPGVTDDARRQGNAPDNGNRTRQAAPAPHPRSTPSNGTTGREQNGQRSSGSIGGTELRAPITNTRAADPGANRSNPAARIEPRTHPRASGAQSLTLRPPPDRRPQEFNSRDRSPSPSDERLRQLFRDADRPRAAAPDSGRDRFDNSGARREQAARPQQDRSVAPSAPDRDRAPRPGVMTPQVRPDRGADRASPPPSRGGERPQAAPRSSAAPAERNRSGSGGGGGRDKKKN
jgi:hypothetical protein